MTDRPDLKVMWHLAFDDERLRLRTIWRPRVVAEVRCPRRAHLQAVVFIGGRFGHWAAYRAVHHARDVWGQEWLDHLAGPVEVTCHCDGVRLVDLTELPPRNRR